MVPYRVLVVDDSAFMRKIISDLIASSPQFHVQDTAVNGREAVEKTRKWQPDIITMDVEMPEMNGLQALEIIMEEMPTPVIMLSNFTDEHAKETILALERGAVDFIRKPSGSISLDLHKVKQALLDKLALAAAAKVTSLRRPIALASHPPNASSVVAPSPRGKPNVGAFRHLVAIGTSTGGPRALQQVLSELPGDFPAPVVVVQHMPPGFTRSLSKRLNDLCQLKVVEASDGMMVESSTVYVAPGGSHMIIVRAADRYYVSLNRNPLVSGHRPSVDCLFESLIPHTSLKRHLVLMTGMGSDGATGMKKGKEAGVATTIAQSEQSCIVYGMPRAAVQLKAVDFEIPLEQISQKLIRIVNV